VSLEENVLVTGSDYENTITRLMELGFPRDHVETAMRAAFNNPERAADYLINVLTMFTLGYSFSSCQSTRRIPTRGGRRGR